MRKQNHKARFFKMIPFFVAIFLASLEGSVFASSNDEEIVYEWGKTHVTREAVLAQRELFEKFELLKEKGSQSSRSDIENIEVSSKNSVPELSQHLDYLPEFKEEYAAFLAGFQDADIKRLEERGLYQFMEYNEERIREEDGSLTIIDHPIQVGTLGVRTREDLESVSRYNVSGDQFNCLFRCFALVNPELREERGRFASRKSFVDYVRGHIADQNVFRYLQGALGRDVVVHARSVGEYLDGYYNDDLCIEPFRNVAKNVGGRDLESADAGFPIALAYLSGVNLTVHTFSDQNHTQLVVDYNHPNGSDRTLNLLLVDGHYTVLAKPEDSKNEILEMEALERENYYSVWCKHYDHVHSSSEPNVYFTNNYIEEESVKSEIQEKYNPIDALHEEIFSDLSALMATRKKSTVDEEVLELWRSLEGQEIEGTPYIYGRNARNSIGLMDPTRGLVYPVFLEDRAATDCFLPAGYPPSCIAEDVELGEWLLNSHTQYKLIFNRVIIGGVGRANKGPIHRVLSEHEHRTTKPMLATFGLALKNLGPDGLHSLSQKYIKTNPSSSVAMAEASNWLYMFNKPEKYFNLSMKCPTAQFLGTTFTHENIPRSVRAKWWKRGFENLIGNMAGASAIFDLRNGLSYPFFSIYYDTDPKALLPRGYEFQEDHENLGWAVINAAGLYRAEILEKILGIPKRVQKASPLALNVSAKPALKESCQWLSTSVGLALSNLEASGELDSLIYEFLSHLEHEEEKFRDINQAVNSIRELAEEVKLENGIVSQILEGLSPGSSSLMDPVTREMRIQAEEAIENCEEMYREVKQLEDRFSPIKKPKSSASKKKKGLYEKNLINKKIYKLRLREIENLRNEKISIRGIKKGKDLTQSVADYLSNFSRFRSYLSGFVDWAVTGEAASRVHELIYQEWADEVADSESDKP